MAQITIQGKKVNVSDNFFQLSPEDQEATVEEIAGDMGLKPASAALQGESVSGIAGMGTRGLIKGAIQTAAAPANVREQAAGGAQWLSEKLGLSPEAGRVVADAVRAGFLAVPGGMGMTGDQVISKVNDVTRPAPTISDLVTGQKPQAFLEKEAETTGEKYADTVGQFVGGSVLGPGSLPARIGTGIAGGLSSETAGQLTEDTPYEDVARFAAGFAGAAAPAGIAGLVKSTAPARQMGVSPASVKKLGRAMEADGVTPQQIANLGPEGMLMDAGPNLRKQGRGVFAHQGEGSKIIDQALDLRAQGTTPRALQAADDAMGPRVNAVEHKQRLEQARKGNGSPMYNSALNNAKSVNTNPVLEAIDEIVQPNVAGMGPESMGSLGAKLVKYRNRLTMMNRGQVTDARALQGIYRDLGDDIGEAIRSGRKGEAGALIDIKKKLEGSIDDATNGGFSKANQQWATDSEIMDAFGFGEDLARNSLTPDEVMSRLKTMKPQARPQVLLGLRNWVYEVVGTARNDAAAARSLLQRGWTQEKLGMVLGKDKAKQLADRIGLERTYAQTDQFVRHGSNTAPGVAGMADVADPSLLGKGNAEALTYGGMKGLVTKKVLDWADAAMNKFAGHRGDMTRTDLAKMLSATGAQRDDLVAFLTHPKTVEALKGGKRISSDVAINLLRTYAATRQQLEGPDR